jgi:hypothetical protein
MGDLIHVTSCLPWFGPALDPIYLTRGRHVHHACHLLDAGKLDWSTVHEPWRGYVRAWETAKRETGMVVLASEVKVEDARHGYCGRLDKIVRIGRRCYVLDLKTGLPSPTVGPQTAAYEGALPQGPPSTRHYRAVVQLNEDGSYKLTTEDTEGQQLFGPNDYRVFLAYLAVAQWEQAHGRSRNPGPGGTE